MKSVLTSATLSIVLINGMPAAPADLVDIWNERAVSITGDAGQGAIIQTRTLAIMQVAIHDALNSIEPRYRRYACFGDFRPGANTEAAIASAAHDSLLGAITVATSPGFGSEAQHQTAIARADAALASDLAALADDTSRALGLEVGKEAAAAVLRLRQDDHATFASQVPYTPGTSPGDWQPTPNPDPPNPSGVASFLPATQPGWGAVTPFILRWSTQFELPGPPRLTSHRFARDFNEIKAVGIQKDSTRTDDQTAIALYWYENASAIWSRFARVVATDRHLDSWETARLLALVNLAMTDGVIAGFREKYTFSFWRPVTAIRAGNSDNNEATQGDPTWSSFLNTPPHPDYPSTHSVEAGAGAEVLRLFFRRDDIQFAATSGLPFAGLTRSYDSFTQAAAENADARVYAGIHFRSAVVDGTRQGQRIGRYVFLHALQPYRHDWMGR